MQSYNGAFVQSLLPLLAFFILITPSLDARADEGGAERGRSA